MKKTNLELRMAQARQKARIPKSKLSSGSTAGKYPISLDGGKTIIFISDKSKEPEARLRYASLASHTVVPPSYKTW
jgi:hypothetical protein